jgi:putative membrane protein
MSDRLDPDRVQHELNLTDRLATDRTILANERTFLAYVRTALSLIVAGVFSIKFFDSVVLEVIGWMFIVAGAATCVIGVRRYRRTNQFIHLLVKRGEVAPPSAESLGEDETPRVKIE